jgi:outer membrane protein assembly factor BamB
VGESFVYVTETINRERECVRGLSLDDGKLVWKQEWAGALSVPFFAKANGDWIRSTPTLAAGRLLVAGIRDVLACFSASDGRELWRVDFPKELGTKLPDFGCVCSPLVEGTSVYLQAGGGFAKLDMETGKLVWKCLDDGGGMYGSAFSSPQWATLHGKKMILVQTRQKLAAVDPETGKSLWEQAIQADRGMNILTPTPWNDCVLTSSYGGKTWLFRTTPSDTGPWKVETVWENKSQGYMSSPIVIGDHAYLHLRNQRLVCIDLRDGTQAWATRPFGKYWSMVTNGQRIMALDASGKLLLITPDPSEFQLVEERHISDQETWAHLAVVDSQIFIRHLGGIDVYDWS